MTYRKNICIMQINKKKKLTNDKVGKAITRCNYENINN